VKAVMIDRYGGGEVLHVADAPVPDPGPGQVRVRVRAAGVNPADTYMVRGGYEFVDVPLPWIPGYDEAGEVDALGPDVTGLAAGQRVFVAGTLGNNPGAFAEYHIASAAVCLPLPDRISFEEGAALGVPYVTAYRALFQRAHLRPSETVLVHGASGGVGQACVQFARARGATVVATAGSVEGLELARAQGAHVTVDHTAPDHTDLLRAAVPGGYDVVAEMAASSNLTDDIALVARGGRIVVIGARGPVDVAPRGLMRPEAAILGVALWNAEEVEQREALAAIAAGVAAGTLRPRIDSVVALERAGEAFDRVTSGHRHGKVVLAVV